MVLELRTKCNVINGNTLVRRRIVFKCLRGFFGSGVIIRRAILQSTSLPYQLMKEAAVISNGWSLRCLHSKAQIFVRGGCWVLSLRLIQFKLQSHTRCACSQNLSQLRGKRGADCVNPGGITAILYANSLSRSNGKLLWCLCISTSYHVVQANGSFCLLYSCGLTKDHWLCASLFFRWFVPWKLDTK